VAIETWKEPEALLRIVPFVIAPRGGVSLEVFAEPPFTAAAVHPLDMMEVDLSSSGLREKVRRGAPIEGSVPPEVARYIDEHGLYRTETLTRVQNT
jgi:nicotinate-nucleotide adenylyltransferase